MCSRSGTAAAHAETLHPNPRNWLGGRCGPQESQLRARDEAMTGRSAGLALVDESRITAGGGGGGRGGGVDPPTFESRGGSAIADWIIGFRCPRPGASAVGLNSTGRPLFGTPQIRERQFPVTGSGFPVPITGNSVKKHSDLAGFELQRNSTP